MIDWDQISAAWFPGIGRYTDVPFPPTILDALDIRGICSLQIEGVLPEEPLCDVRILFGTGYRLAASHSILYQKLSAERLKGSYTEGRFGGETEALRTFEFEVFQTTLNHQSGSIISPRLKTKIQEV